MVHIFVFYLSSVNDILWFPNILEETIRKFFFQSFPCHLFPTFSFIISLLSGNIPLPVDLTLIFTFALQLNTFNAVCQFSCHVFTNVSLII